ncbi:hypothetical protein FNV43_RR09773 [Rhamnella rubrinervis]|uniref:Uncharacterized protein n=1 Tax=Rhamnella rubrinervis TaxID=2594499 RepID=A0A8K0HBC2_9ROSA|nr:hypothetical protein FNV43_RR09773 [Rhamnella rubrinervis]
MAKALGNLVESCLPSMQRRHPLVKYRGVPSIHVEETPSAKLLRFAFPLSKESTLGQNAEGLDRLPRDAFHPYREGTFGQIIGMITRRAGCPSVPTLSKFFTLSHTLERGEAGLPFTRLIDEIRAPILTVYASISTV